MTPFGKLAGLLAARRENRPTKRALEPKRAKINGRRRRLDVGFGLLDKEWEEKSLQEKRVKIEFPFCLGLCEAGVKFFCDKS